MAEDVSVLIERIEGMRREQAQFREDVGDRFDVVDKRFDKSEDDRGKLILAIVGFALSVAGSAALLLLAGIGH